MEKEKIVCVMTVMNEYKQQEYMELLKACDLEVHQSCRQDVKSIDFRTYIGSGKVEEIAEIVIQSQVESVHFDIDLSPLQVRNLEEVFQVPVIDREELILEIFNRRAITKVAKMQIELARLKKILPRLIGSNTQLSRQSGGKNKGAGEKQLELDRRRIKARISELRTDLKHVEKERATQRRQRMKARLPIVALVGYTNAGKSTLMNAILDITKSDEDKQVMQKDMLFATLDTAVRKIELPTHHDFLLIDTVGFVSDLPHNLIEAFHSTLEEITFADLIIHVVDASNDQHDMHMQITNQTLQDLHAAHLPILTVYNKCDISEYPYPQINKDCLFISAHERAGLNGLMHKITDILYSGYTSYQLMIPYDEATLFSTLMKNFDVQNIEHEDNGIYCLVTLSDKDKKQYQKFIIPEQS